MIKPTINENDEIELNGEMAKGDVVPNRCCTGYDWTVLLIFDDPNPLFVHVLGFCDNPNCPDYDHDIGPSDLWRGVNSISAGDLAEWMLNQEEKP